MRSVWNGSVGFDLVNVPVKMYSATEDHDLKSHQVHDHDNGRISYVKTCTTCNKAVSSANISKMYEVDGQTAILTDDELSELDAEKSKEMEVLEFVPAADIDPVMVDKSYYLSPDGRVKAYALLSRVLKDAGRVAIVNFSLRGKTRLAALTVTGKNDVMVLHTLLWPDEVREAAFTALDNKPQLSDAEVKQAARLVDHMRNEFNPDRYRDTYREELRELVLSKAIETETSGDTPDDVSDLMAKLEASNAAREQKKAKPPIRQWAKSRGIPIGDRGRIPTDIIDQYNREAVPA